jgi:translation elongation factor EF-Ts
MKYFISKIQKKKGIGENMSLRRAVIFNVKPGQYISHYMHGSSKKMNLNYKIF